MTHDSPADRCGVAHREVGHSLVRRAAAAWGMVCFLEMDWLARYPISPAGAPRIVGAEDGYDRRPFDLDFGEIGWRLAAPAGTEARTTSTTFALDVYQGLTALLAAAGYPSNGRVEFSAYSLLVQLNRASLTAKNGTAVISPNGSAYQDLGRALEYLSRTSFSHGVAGPSGTAEPTAPSEFRILSEYRLAEASGGPSVARFSVDYMSRLLAAQRLVFLDRVLYKRLSPGFPRSLYRLLSAEYPNQRVSYRGMELLQRLGSTQQASSGSRLTQRLARAHEELMKHAVLEREPEIIKDRRVWHVTYHLAGRPAPWTEKMSFETRWVMDMLVDDPDIHDDLRLLVTQASAYGVRLETAVGLARSNPRALARTLAATALGILWPEKGLPHLIVRYAREDHPIVDRRAGIRPRRAEESGNTGAGYLIDIAAERRRCMAAVREGRSSRSVDWIPHAAERIVLELGAGHEPWVAEGIQAILAQLHFELPGYMPP